MTYVELHDHIVLSNCFLLALRLFKCFGCQIRATMLKTSGSISSHTSKIFWSFRMDKLIRYSVELLTHSCFQGLCYFKNYIYTKLKLKYEYIFYYIYRLYIYQKKICHYKYIYIYIYNRTLTS
jgi:hypothetical protein